MYETAAWFERKIHVNRNFFWFTLKFALNALTFINFIVTLEEKKRAYALYWALTRINSRVFKHNFFSAQTKIAHVFISLDFIFIRFYFSVFVNQFNRKYKITRAIEKCSIDSSHPNNQKREARDEAKRKRTTKTHLFDTIIYLKQIASFTVKLFAYSF